MDRPTGMLPRALLAAVMVAGITLAFGLLLVWLL